MLLTVALGALTGLVLALTGAGGGSLAVPLLVLVLHLPMQEAAPMALLAVGLAASVGAAMGLKEGVVRYKAALLMAGTGMLMAPVGVWLAQRLDQRLLLTGFGAILLLQAWRQLRPPSAEAFNPPPCAVHPSHGRIIWTSPCARALAITGALAGGLSGLVGVGGGFVIVPALQRHTDLNLRSVQATSMAVIALVASSGIGSAALHGQLAGWQTMPFIGGALVALLAGRAWAQHIPATQTQKLFAWTGVTVATLMIGKGLLGG